MKSPFGSTPLHLCLTALTFPWLIQTTQAQTGTQNAVITVDANLRTGSVPPFVMGSNVEAADGFGIFSKEHSYMGARTGGGLWNPQTRTPIPEVLEEVRTLGTKMIRYPGGCLVHGFDWKLTVGPPETRPDFLFGVEEYVQYCRTVGAEPLMIISDYTGNSSDAADLVEYLNAPATAAHPWAQKRAQWGHPQPYGVKYFEMGNESDHGNHDLKPARKFTAEEYGAWVNEYSKKMKAVDPTIRLGALMATGTIPEDPWNDIVLNLVKQSADFIVIHKYAVGLNSPNEPVKYPADLLMRASMASADQLDAMLGKYREKIQRLTGKSLPLALTEYNALFVQDKPIPYRFSLGSALFSADYVRVLMRPDSNVLMANYWQLINGYWGLMQRPINAPSPAPIKKQPAYYLFRLWSQHFGTEQVATTVNSPRITFEGFAPRVRPAQSDTYLPETVSQTNLLENCKFQGSNGQGYRIEAENDGLLRATLTDFKGENYVPLATVKSSPGDSYVISFDARSTGDLTGTNMGLGLMDSRGYAATRSAIGVEGIEKAPEWKNFVGHFSALPDNPGVDIIWRLRAGTSPVSGALEIKNLKVMRWQQEKFPAYAAMTSSSSLSADGKKLFVMVFNKHHSDAINTTLQIKNFPVRTARRWTVTGPALESTNVNSEEVKETESGTVIPVRADLPLEYVAPAHSMTAWEFSLTPTN